MSSINIDERSSLFVGDLHPDVTEEMLLNTFIPFGPIFSVRVCRDRETLLSLGYGYVNFVNLADAENALDTLLFQVLIDRPMRIMFSQRDATLRKTGIGNIFIKGLAKSINSLALYNTFSTFGDILSCKVVCDKNGSKVYGYVHFATYEAAEMAIRKLNGMMLNDQIVSIYHYKLYEERQAERMASFETRNQDHQRQYPGVSLYVSNLPYNMHDEQLRTAFSPFGTVISAKVMMENGRSKGFGFVAFISAESATKAVATMNGRVVGGRFLRVVLSLHNQEKSRPGNNEHENESPPPALRPIPPDVPSGQFVATVPQVPDSVSVCPVNQLARLQPNSRRAAVGVLPQGESLRPLISAALLDVLNSELSRLLISVTLDFKVNEVVSLFDTSQTIEATLMSQALNQQHPRRQLALPAPSPDPQVPDSVSVCPVNQLTQIQQSSRRAAVGVRPRGESLRPLISAALLDVLNSELSRLLISVTLDFKVSDQAASLSYKASGLRLAETELEYNSPVCVSR
ncbi:polyadenylate-binding protein 1A-like [Myxocyprinus asiaticus]|uniref:polyadenylate-binding protein 1A-like n=1 Tax=Myxocyprinus asiaticus TaxID=70543 RepID=UPI00222183B3|nr:polyadenylate-binding protein 1A-like [Myxocyprinus asiaticus]